MSSLLYVPWFLKPVYGFLGDYFFPFHYRVKGYVLIWASIAVCSTVGMIFLLPEEDSPSSFVMNAMLVVEILNMVALSFIDSVCRRQF